MNMAQGDPVVSVVCAWYNRANYLRDTLDSLLGQEFDSFEVVIVNDGSSDPRVTEILAVYSDPRLKIISQPNAGFVRSIKRAIAEARGQFIAVQGAGDVSLPMRLREQVAALLSDDSIGAVGCKRYEVVIGGEADGSRAESKLDTQHPTLKDLLYGINPFSHGEVMFRRTVYDQVGGYREFFRFAQDRDLWIRMAAHCKLYVIDQVMYERRAFVEDGIASNHEKLALQQAFSSFSRQCHFDRVRFGADFVDKYGLNAGLFRKPQKSYADALARISIQALFFGKMDSARKFSSLAVYEKKTSKSVFAYVAAAFSSRSSLFHTFFRFAVGNVANTKIWPRQ